jgi:hypothetical protein
MSGQTGELYTAFINFTTTNMDYLRGKNYERFNRSDVLDARGI